MNMQTLTLQQNTARGRTGVASLWATGVKIKYEPKNPDVTTMVPAMFVAAKSTVGSKEQWCQLSRSAELNSIK